MPSDPFMDLRRKVFFKIREKLMLTSVHPAIRFNQMPNRGISVGPISTKMGESMPMTGHLLETPHPIGLLVLLSMLSGRTLTSWFLVRVWPATKFSRLCVGWISLRPIGKGTLWTVGMAKERLTV